MTHHSNNKMNKMNKMNEILDDLTVRMDKLEDELHILENEYKDRKQESDQLKNKIILVAIETELALCKFRLPSKSVKKHQSAREALLYSSGSSDP